MMRNHLTAAELAAYHERRLPPTELLRASDHVGACEECRGHLLELANAAPDAISGASSGEVLYEELAGWLDNELDPLTRGEVAAALANSASARRALADLAAFREEMNALPATDHAAATAALPTAQRRLPRWTFPLAAALLVSGAALWWATAPTDTADYVTLRDGDRVLGFSADGRSQVLAALPEGVRDSVAETIRTGRVGVDPDIATIAGQPGTLAGSDDEGSELQALEPIGTAVRDVRPRFRWRGAAGVSGYNIHIAEETSGAVVMTQQLPADATEWQPAEPLPAGEVYQWEVQALRDGAVVANSPRPPEPEARFQILSAAKVAELEEAQRASKGSHLVMAIANARAGLLDDAIREFRLLREQNPDSALLRQLLDQLEAQRKPKR